MYVCTYECMYICTYVYVCIFYYLSMLHYNCVILHADFTHYCSSCLEGKQRFIYVCMYVCMYVRTHRVKIFILGAASQVGSIFKFNLNFCPIK